MKPERNKPCACGIGKKHKRCCGTAEAHNAAMREREAGLERWRLERAQRIDALGRHPSLCALSAVLAASLAMKRL